MQILNTKNALDFVDNDISLLKMLLEGFIKDAPFEKTDLYNLIKKNEFELAAKYVHRVKGAARQLSAELLATKGQELEDVLRKKTQGNVQKLAMEFSDLYQITFKEISDTFNNL